MQNITVKLCSVEKSIIIDPLTQLTKSLVKQCDWLEKHFSVTQQRQYNQCMRFVYIRFTYLFINIMDIPVLKVWFNNCFLIIERI